MYLSCSIFKESDGSLKTCDRFVSEGGESYVYGRGALDVKLALFGILEADIHSANLPLVIYYPSGVRHIRWDLY